MNGKKIYVRQCKECEKDGKYVLFETEEKNAKECPFCDRGFGRKEQRKNNTIVLGRWNL